MQTNAPPTLAEVMGTIDELAAAARAGDAEHYRAALRVGERQGLNDDQMSDAYRWGRRHQGAAAFDWRGGVDRPRNTLDLLDSIDQLD